MTETTFAVGDLVKFAPPYDTGTYAGTYRVTKINPKTIAVEPVNGGRGVRAERALLLPATVTDEERAAMAKARSDAALADALNPLHAGTVVTATNLRGATPGTLYVVTGETPKGYRLSQLGGAMGYRYYTGVPRRLLTVVPMDALAERLVDSL